MKNSDTVVAVDGLGKRYVINESVKLSIGKLEHLINCLKFNKNPIGQSYHWALKDISFTVNRGERVGIIGMNGAGKSTLLKIMSRVSYPTIGEIRVFGSLTSLLEVGTGFNDNLSGRDNIYLNASLHGMSKSQIDQKFNEVVEFSEVRRFIDTPLKYYSSGMRMRLAFSVAAHLDPDILLLDEVLAVGDMSFQLKCLERVDQLTSNGQTLFFVSHSMDSVMRYCNRCIWLENGKIRLDDSPEYVCSAYAESILSIKATYSSQKSNVPVKHLQGNSISGLTSDPKKDDVPKLESIITRSAAVGSHGSQEYAESGSVNIEDSHAELISAKVCDINGVANVLHSVSDTICVEMVFEIYGKGIYVPGLKLYCSDGRLAFVSIKSVRDPIQYQYEVAGRYCACVRLPSNMLNIGKYFVTLSLFNPEMSPYKRYFVKEQVLSFETIEGDGTQLTAKGCLPRPIPGPVRPKLDWTVQIVASP